MKDKEKPDGRGQFAIRRWEEAKRSGGLSYSPEQIEAILEESGDKMLTREEVKRRISTYLQSCLTIAQDEDSGEAYYIWKRNPTKAALALTLGVSQGTLSDYMNGRDRHGNYYKPVGENKGVQKIATADFDLIQKAYGIITDFYESKLADNKNNSGVIFWLLNRENKQWRNEQEIKIGGTEQPERKVLTITELPVLGKHENLHGDDLPQLGMKSNYEENENGI